MRAGLIPGYNVDRLNIAAGMAELVACGYPASESERHMVIQYALQRWVRGEEEAAQRGAIDQSFHGIRLVCWLRVLAAAMAGVETDKAAALEGETMRDQSKGGDDAAD